MVGTARRADAARHDVGRAGPTRGARPPSHHRAARRAGGRMASRRVLRRARCFPSSGPVRIFGTWRPYSTTPGPASSREPRSRSGGGPTWRITRWARPGSTPRECSPGFATTRSPVSGSARCSSRREIPGTRSSPTPSWREFDSLGRPRQYDPTIAAVTLLSVIRRSTPTGSVSSPRHFDRLAGGPGAARGHPERPEAGGHRGGMAACAPVIQGAGDPLPDLSLRSLAAGPGGWQLPRQQQWQEGHSRAIFQRSKSLGQFTFRA